MFFFPIFKKLISENHKISHNISLKKPGFEIERGELILTFHFLISFFGGRLGQPVDLQNFSRIRNYKFNIASAQI